MRFISHAGINGSLSKSPIRTMKEGIGPELPGGYGHLAVEQSPAAAHHWELSSASPTSMLTIAASVEVTGGLSRLSNVFQCAQKSHFN